MEINLGVSDFFKQRIETKTDQFLEARGIKVRLEGQVPKSGLVVANHPTHWDSIFLRKAVPGSYHAVNELALRKTGINPIDRWIALNASFMIPVYQGNRSSRQKTYYHVDSVLKKGRLIFFNPTGKSSYSNALPPREDIIVGGLIRIQQVARVESLYPAYVFVKGQILQDGSVEAGSEVLIKIGESFNASQNEESLRNSIYSSWEVLFEQLCK